MGIRFFCETCQRKLNVKAFLAGKRGICPHCGAKVWIPETSQLPTSKDDAVEADRDAMDLPSIMLEGAEPAVVPQSAGSSSTATVSLAADDAGASAEVALPAPAPAEASTSLATSVQDQVDPIAEAPNAVWYVRPPSGGQYGPATGDVMRKWLAEGRVSSDSLIWREGWSDWRTAGPEFSSLPNGPLGTISTSADPSIVQRTSTDDDEPVAAQRDAPPATSTGYRVQRRQTNGMGLITVVVLGLLVLVLGIVLVVVLSRGGAKNPDERTQLLNAKTPHAVIVRIGANR